MKRIRIELDIKKHGADFFITDMVCQTCWRLIKPHDEVVLGKPPCHFWLMCKRCYAQATATRRKKRSVKAILADYRNALKRKKRLIKREMEKEYAH